MVKYNNDCILKHAHSETVEEMEREREREHASVMNPWVTIDGCNYQMAGFKSSLIDVISSMSDY